MNVDILNRTGLHAASMSKMAIADGDIHPRPAGVGIGGVSKSLYPYLSRRWIDHVEEFGIQYRQPWEKGSAYPKAQPQACRRDAFLPDGRAPGSDLAFMAEQHLDPNNVALGILNPLTSGQGAVNPLLSDAITHATNEWQKAEWTSQDKRLRGSVVVPYEDAAASVKEIELRAGDGEFAQVLLLSRTAEPLCPPRTPQNLPHLGRQKQGALQGLALVLPAKGQAVGREGDRAQLRGGGQQASAGRLASAGRAHRPGPQPYRHSPSPPIPAQCLPGPGRRAPGWPAAGPRAHARPTRTRLRAGPPPPPRRPLTGGRGDGGRVAGAGAGDARAVGEAV